MDIQKEIAGERVAEARKMRSVMTVDSAGTLIGRYTYHKAAVDYFL